MNFMLVLALSILAQELPGREKASSFTILRPRGWLRQDLADNTIVFVPSGPDAQQCSMYVFPGQNSDAGELVFHENLFQGINRGNRIEGNVEKGQRGRWRSSRAKAVTAQGQFTWMALYTTKVDTRLEGILYMAGAEEIFKSHRFEVERLLLGAEFPGDAPPPPGGAEWKPAPLPEKEVPIAGAWTMASRQAAPGAVPGTGGAQDRSPVKTLVLFGNQVAAKLDSRQAGRFDLPDPDGNLATLDVARPAVLKNRPVFGAWSEAEGKIRIAWNDGTEDLAVKQGKDLQNGGILWPALQPIDGVRLDGSFAREEPGSVPRSIRFRTDGTFETDRLNEALGGKPVHRKFPELGTGSYEFRKWSLILRFDTGYVQSFQAAFSSEKPAAADAILLDGLPFFRPGAAGSTLSGIAGDPPAGVPLAPGEIFHGLRLQLPAGWINRKDPGGSFLLAPPPELNPKGYYLLVLPPSRIPGTHWEAHKALIQAALVQMQVTRPSLTLHFPDAPGIFIRSTTSGNLATGELRELQIFTAAHDGTLEAIVCVGSEDFGQFQTMLKEAGFKDPIRPPVRSKILEAYRRANQKYSPTLGGGPLALGKLAYERIWLRDDGTADFTTYYREGYAASPMALKIDPGLKDGQAGSWKEEGGKIQIVRQSTLPVEMYERRNGLLVSGNKEWRPMPRVDGMKLSGRWSVRSAPGENFIKYYHWLEFTEPGRFQTDGALTFMTVLDSDAPRPPERGSGAYEIRDWTIFFKFDDGKSWSTDFSTITDDPKDLSFILLRTTAFTRE